MTILGRRHPAEKTDRNAHLIKDYKKGIAIIDLIAKYRITSARIYQIIHIWEMKHL